MGNSFTLEDMVTQQLLIVWLSWPLAALIILANIFTILGILFNRKLHGATSWFFLSLLFSDLLAGIALPHIPWLSFETTWDYHLCFFMYVTPNFLFLSFSANLLVVHYAKYVCIIYPLRYHTFWVHRWAVLYICLAWAASLIFACLPLTWNEWDPNKNCSFHLVFPKPYLYLETYGFLIPAIFAMAYMCIRMLWVAQKHLRNITKLFHSVNQSQAPTELQHQLELRKAKGVAIVSLIFLVCWVPYIACLNISVLPVSHKVNPLVLKIVICLGTGSGAAVPIILSLSNHQYTQFWRDMTTKVWATCFQGQGCEQRQVRPEANLPGANLYPLEADPNGVPG
ncbi:G-protein coupled bile acid receptor 1 [Tiliqua scincoides]|uniref:G-protein coupled bile acid receptor 1 n=1 Tax=Tiliqua scincoides TaxID=71010 RepID=UPI003462BB67